MKQAGTVALILSIIIVIIPLAACTPGGADPAGGGAVTTPPATNAGTADVRPVAFTPADGLSPAVSGALGAFSLDLFRRAAAEDAGKNVFLSPLSVWLALCMTYNGAAGETAEGMAAGLHAQGIAREALNGDNAGLMGILTAADPAVQIALANSIWMRKGTEAHIKEDFLERNRSFYGAKVDALVFNDAAADTINRWVEENTNGNIKELVEKPIDTGTVMFLINAIHFKAPWAEAFDEKETRDGAFTASGGEEVAVKYMSRNRGSVGYVGEDVIAVRLPYAAGRLEMMAVMPLAQPLDAFIAALTPEELDRWAGQCAESDLPLLFPRFKVEYDVKLNDILIGMGMEKAFHGADFTAMSDLGLHISKVLHKSFAEVNEQGTEASAATLIEMQESAPMAALHFTRPFVYLVRDTKTGAILFIGAMHSPAN